jgi:hypothetical protein
MMKTCVLASAAAVAFTAGLAHAQIQVIYTNIAGAPGNVVPGLSNGWSAGTTTRFDRVYRSGTGAFWVLGGFANEAVTADRVVVRGSGPTRTGAILIVQEGTLAPFDAAYTYSFFEQQLAVNDAGEVAFINDMTTLTAADEVMVVHNSDGTFQRVAYRETEAAPGFDVGVNIGAQIESAGLTSDGRAAAEVQLAGTGITTGNDFAIIVGNGYGSANILGREGTPVGSGIGPLAPAQAFDDDDFAIDATASNFLYSGDDNAASSDSYVVYNNAVVLRENSPVAPGGPVAGTNPFRRSVLSGNGEHWLVRGISSTAAPSTNDDDWVVRNGVVVARGLNPITPANPTAELFDDATFGDLFFSIAVNNNGDYVIGGVTNSTDINANAVLVLNGERVIAREGDPVDVNEDGDPSNDNAFIAVFNDDDAVLGDDLNYYFMANLRDGLGTVIGQAFLVIDLNPDTGTCPVCPADFDQDGGVTGADVESFFLAFEAGDPCGDTDLDGGVTGADVEAFFLAFEAGGC